VSDARRHRRRHPEDADGGLAGSRRCEAPPQIDDITRKEAVAQLDRALATIDVGRRAVLVLHEIEEMTAPEIAKAMNLPLNTVYSRLRVARDELERALLAEGLAPAAEAPPEPEPPSGPMLLGHRDDRAIARVRTR
jgi:RNA polymerase sigma-70 factor (ECF subfamily)